MSANVSVILRSLVEQRIGGVANLKDAIDFAKGQVMSLIKDAPRETLVMIESFLKDVANEKSSVEKLGESLIDIERLLGASSYLKEGNSAIKSYNPTNRPDLKKANYFQMEDSGSAISPTRK